MGMKGVSAVRKTLIAWAAVLPAASGVLAAGNLLASFQATQAPAQVTITTVPAAIAESWPNAEDDERFVFTITVTNPTTVNIGPVHLHIFINCNPNALPRAEIEEAIVVGDLFGGPADACVPAGVTSIGKPIGPAASQTWSFAVTFDGGDDSVVWTIEARTGLPPSGNLLGSITRNQFVED